jgi:hypothetical protein
LLPNLPNNKFIGINTSLKDDFVAALPPDVRKGFAFPCGFLFLFEALPHASEGSRRSLSPKSRAKLSGEAKPSPHIRRQSRNKQAFLACVDTNG